MLELVRYLRDVKGPTVWAVTSHATMNLVTGDDYRLPTLVSIASVEQYFLIEYRIPPEKAPWPDAYVKGSSNDLTRIGEMILFGLNEALQAADVNNPLA
jgi:hypothetical protein